MAANYAAQLVSPQMKKPGAFAGLNQNQFC